MKDPVDALSDNVAVAVDAMNQFVQDADRTRAFRSAVSLVVEQLRAGGRLYIAGNGGSAADAQHLAAEFVGRMTCDRTPLAAEALTADSSLITAIANDYGYTAVFARQLEAKAASKDVFLAITTSGESPNIVFALQTCRKLGIPSIVLTGRDGGSAAHVADIAIVAFGERTSTIQESHIVLAHTLCECAENALLGDCGVLAQVEPINGGAQPNTK